MFTPEIFYGLGALLLFAALAWAVLRVRGRNKANDPITEAATRDEYDHPDRYKRDQEEFRREVRPS